MRTNSTKSADQREVLVAQSTIGRIPTYRINNLTLNGWSPKSLSGYGLKESNIVSRVLGRRWSLSILKNFCNKEVIRFNELKRALEGISSTVLSDSLLELEHEGIVSKKIYPEIPPRVEYRLTPQARELESIINELEKWASRWKSPQVENIRLQ